MKHPACYTFRLLNGEEITADAEDVEYVGDSWIKDLRIQRPAYFIVKGRIILLPEIYSYDVDIA